jgi:dienelactone hydrolase
MEMKTVLVFICLFLASCATQPQLGCGLLNLSQFTDVAFAATHPDPISTPTRQCVWVQPEPDWRLIDPKRIGIIGFSRGANIALGTANATAEDAGGHSFAAHVALSESGQAGARRPARRTRDDKPGKSLKSDFGESVIEVPGERQRQFEGRLTPIVGIG